MKSSLLAYNLSLEVTAQTPDAFKAQRLNEGNQAALLKFLEPLVRAILLQEMKGLDGSLNAQARRAQRGEEVPAVRPGLDSIPGTARTGAENLGSAPAPAVRLSDEEVAA